MQCNYRESRSWHVKVLSLVPAQVLGAISFALMVVNTLFWACFLFPIAGLKLIIPIRAWQDRCNAVLNEIALMWIAGNNANLRLTKNIRWDVSGLEGLNPRGRYLVISNHQSWVDILVLQKVFHRRIPLLKFFLKKELIWVPIMGLAWWALEFPFMKRYSREFLEKNPHMRGKDLEITKKACERFSRMPIAVMNFVEGTRFTPKKHADQSSPFTYLLKPKAGGISFVLSAMEGNLNHIINTTIIYPRGVKTFWEFLCCSQDEIIVRVEVIPITTELRGDYSNDPDYQKHFQAWLNRLWVDKDQVIGSCLRVRDKAA
ncbi:MAG: acyltransferase [Desulfomonilia bacterium]